MVWRSQTEKESTRLKALKENYHKSHKLYIVKVSPIGLIRIKVKLAAL